MEKYLYGIGIFMAGLIIGWLNPIEGPLDWTYDEYASRPAHKSPVKAAPIVEEKPQEIIWFFEEDGDIMTVPPLLELFMQDKDEEK